MQLTGIAKCYYHYYYYYYFHHYYYYIIIIVITIMLLLFCERYNKPVQFAITNSLCISWQCLTESTHGERSIYSEFLIYVTPFAFPLSTHDDSNRMPYLSFSFGCYSWFQSSLVNTREISSNNTPAYLCSSSPLSSS